MRSADAPETASKRRHRDQKESIASAGQAAPRTSGAATGWRAFRLRV
jgi:hypothetical protein